jgi:hypothetical protein
VFFADADVPGIRFAEVKTERIGPDGDANANVTVAEQHTFEKIGSWQFAHNLMTARDICAIQFDP